MAPAASEITIKQYKSMVELKNEQLSIVVSEKGAELQSIKDTNGKEYLCRRIRERSRAPEHQGHQR